MINELNCKNVNEHRNMTGFVINNNKLFEKGGIFSTDTDINCNYQQDDNITFKEKKKTFYKKDGDNFKTNMDETNKNNTNYIVLDRFFNGDPPKCIYLKIKSGDEDIWVNIDDIKKAEAEAPNPPKKEKQIDGTMVCPSS